MTNKVLTTSIKFAGILLGITLFNTSCKKAQDWDCLCTYTEDGVSKSRTHVINNRKKEDAKGLCVTNLVNGPGVTDASCNLQD